MRAWGPSTGSTACALAGRRCSLWGWRTGLPGGGAFHHREGRLRSGAPPPPTARPLGGLLGSATHVLWAQVCGCGGPTLSPWPACPVGAACRGGGGRPTPGGLASHRCEGYLVSGAFPPLAARPLGRAAGASATRVFRVRSVRVWGPSTGPTVRALAGRHCAPWGWRKGVPRGVPSAIVRGVWGQALPLPRLPAPGRAAGAHYPLAAGAGGCGRGDPSPTPQRALLRAGFAHCGGSTRAPGGGAYCLGVGRPGSGALPPPTARPLGGLPGPTTHWLWVRGGAGVETPHQPHSARSCVLWGRHEGARGGRLLPGWGTSGVGRSFSPDCPPSGRAAGAHYPLAVGVGGCGRGNPSPTPQRALLRAVGAA